MHPFTKATLVLLFLFTGLHAQVSEIDRLIANEFKMTFPSIYFRHNSTEYAKMPYTADSCYRYIANHFKADVTELVIWRDSAETETLTDARIKLLKAGLKKYLPKEKIEIESMGEEQKISRQTIGLTNDSAKINYLLSFNSVMDFANTNFPVTKKNTGDHVMHPKINCLACWAHGFWIAERHNRKKAARRRKKRKEESSLSGVGEVTFLSRELYSCEIRTAVHL